MKLSESSVYRVGEARIAVAWVAGVRRGLLLGLLDLSVPLGEGVRGRLLASLLGNQGSLQQK